MSKNATTTRYVVMSRSGEIFGPFSNLTKAEKFVDKEYLQSGWYDASNIDELDWEPIMELYKP